MLGRCTPTILKTTPGWTFHSFAMRCFLDLPTRHPGEANRQDAWVTGWWSGRGGLLDIGWRLKGLVQSHPNTLSGGGLGMSLGSSHIFSGGVWMLRLVIKPLAYHLSLKGIGTNTYTYSTRWDLDPVLSGVTWGPSIFDSTLRTEQNTDFKVHGFGLCFYLPTSPTCFPVPKMEESSSMVGYRQYIYIYICKAYGRETHTPIP